MGSHIDIDQLHKLSKDLNAAASELVDQTSYINDFAQYPNEIHQGDEFSEINRYILPDTHAVIERLEKSLSAFKEKAHVNVTTVDKAFFSDSLRNNNGKTSNYGSWQDKHIQNKATEGEKSWQK